MLLKQSSTTFLTRKFYDLENLGKEIFWSRKLKISLESKNLKMEIIEDKDNEVLGRKEVKIIVEAEKNPSLDEAAEKVSSQFKADKNLVVIKKVQSKFGMNTFLIEAYIYSSNEDKEKIEPKSKKKDEGEKKEGEEKPAETPAEPEKQEEQTEPAQETEEPKKENAEPSEESQEKIEDNKQELGEENKEKQNEKQGEKNEM